MIKRTKLPNIKLNYLTLSIVISLPILFVISDKASFPIIITSEIPTLIISIISIIFLLGYCLKFGVTQGNIKYIFVTLTIYFLFMLSYSFVDIDMDGIKASLRIFFYGLLLFLLSFDTLIVKKLLFIINLFSILSVYFFLNWIPTNETVSHSGIFSNSNTLAIIMYIILFFHILLFALRKQVKHKLFITLYSYTFITIDLILIYVSTSRAVWLALFVGVIIYFFFNIIIIKRWAYRLSFILLLSVVITFSYIYPKVLTTNLGLKINQFLINYTGKDFYGRQDIWSHIITAIESKPLIGHGISTIATDIHDVTYMAHNTFLSILLQSGIIGFLLYCLVLYLIWDFLYPGNLDYKIDNKIMKLFSSFFAGLIIYQTFELAFIKGSYSIIILEWIIISIGIGMKRNKEAIAKN